MHDEPQPPPDAPAPPPRRPGEAQRGLLASFARMQRGAGIATGIALTLVLHIAAAIVLGVPLGLIAATTGGNIAGVALMFVGVTQFLYVVPAWIALRRAGARHVALGLLIGASVTFLLNATCLGIVIVSLGNLH